MWKRVQCIKTVGKNVLKNPGGALEIGVNVGSAFASRSPKAALSTLAEVMKFAKNFITPEKGFT